MRDASTNTVTRMRSRRAVSVSAARGCGRFVAARRVARAAAVRLRQRARLRPRRRQRDLGGTGLMDCGIAKPQRHERRRRCAVDASERRAHVSRDLRAEGRQLSRPSCTARAITTTRCARRPTATTSSAPTAPGVDRRGGLARASCSATIRARSARPATELAAPMLDLAGVACDSVHVVAQRRPAQGEPAMQVALRTRSKQILRKKAFAHLATLMPDGSPAGQSGVGRRRRRDDPRQHARAAGARTRTCATTRASRCPSTDPDNPYSAVMIRGRVVETTTRGRATEHIDAHGEEVPGQGQVSLCAAGRGARALQASEPDSVSMTG